MEKPDATTAMKQDPRALDVQNRETESARAQCDLSVIAPCYNEMENVNALVERLRQVFQKRGLNGEIVLVNDASRDETGRLILELAQQYPNEVTAIHHERNRGIAGAWKSGLANSRGKYVCLIDADLQYLPEAVWHLYREMQTSRADVIQGFRSTIERLQDSRYLYSKALNILLNACFGMNLRDNKSGFVLMRRETLADILEHRFQYYYFNTFITIAAKAKGYSVREVETLFKNRNLGQSYIRSFPAVLIAKALVDIGKALIEYHWLQTSAANSMEAYIKKQPNPPQNKPYTGWRKMWLAVYFATMPLHAWTITARARRDYDLLKRSEWFNAEQIQQLQCLRLQQLIRHCYYHVPYYGELMRTNGLRPEDIRTPNDLSKLPLLSKDAVRENLYFDLFSDTHRKAEMAKISTSGSTGEPFSTYTDRRQLEMRWATTFRALEWTGWRFGDKQARLWHQTIGMSKSQVWREKIDAWLMRRLFIPAFELNDANLPLYLEKMKRFRPRLIDGYAEGLNLLAHAANKHHVSGLFPLAMISSAQVMPQPMRERIEREFNTKVFDKYGSREFSGIAYQCGHSDGYHVMAESYLVEILKEGRPAKPGEVGEIVITDLNNFSAPLIRYRIGDLATTFDESTPCPCGRSLPRIGRIEGRSQAIILCPNGTWLPGAFFAHFFKDYDHAIRQYQVVQERKGAITLRIVPENQYSPAIAETMVERMRPYIGEAMDVEIELTDLIPLLKTGKRTGVVSKLDYDFQTMG
jgi:phenylacetate-CoA ligase